MSDAPWEDRCPWAISFGSLATRCMLARHVHENRRHEARGLAEFPYQTIEWFAGDRREYETDREDAHAWEAR